MKFTTPIALALAAIFQSATADFDVYRVGVGGTGVTGNAWGYQVYNGEPSCDDMLNWIWRKSDDVSGGKYGVRCKGTCNPMKDPSGIEEMEFNFNGDELHWTTYKSRNWGLFDIDDVKVGSCEILPGDDFYCGLTIGRAEGGRHLRCKIDDTTAGDINDNKPS